MTLSFQWHTPVVVKALAFAEVAQPVEHATENCGVPSSILGLGTGLFPDCVRGSIRGSSNGRTGDFESSNRGSNPRPRACIIA